MSTDILNGIKELWHVPTGRLLYGGGGSATITRVSGYNDYFPNGTIEMIEALTPINNNIFVKKYINYNSNINDGYSKYPQQTRVYGAYDFKNNRDVYKLTNWYNRLLYVNEKENYIICQRTAGMGNFVTIIDTNTGSEIWGVSPRYEQCYIGIGFGKIVIFDSQYWITIYDIKSKSKIREVNLSYPNTLPDGAYSNDNDVRYCYVNSDNTAIIRNTIYDLTTGKIIGNQKDNSYISNLDFYPIENSNYVLRFGILNKLRKLNKSDLSLIAEYDFETMIKRYKSDFSYYGMFESMSIVNVDDNRMYICLIRKEDDFTVIFNHKTNTIEKFYDYLAYFNGNTKMMYLLTEHLKRYVIKENI